MLEALPTIVQNGLALNGTPNSGNPAKVIDHGMIIPKNVLGMKRAGQASDYTSMLDHFSYDFLLKQRVF